MSRKCTVLLVMICVFAFATNAFALDKRLKLMFKTAGYGAAGGLVIGAGTAAMGLGGFRNVLMGTSAGLYAGIALAVYIIATPNETEDERSRRLHPGSRPNPYGPRKPVGPDDYEDDDDGLEQNLPPKQPESSLTPGPDRGRRTTEVAVWAPLVSLSF